MAIEKKKLVAIGAGHGPSTPGKRTPKFSDGSCMHENEFNQSVAMMLAIDLERNNIKTILVAASYEDTPLHKRVRISNNAKADIYISIHANATTGKWNNVSGIETFHYPGSLQGAKLANCVHTCLVKGSALPDKKIKTAKFYVLKHTKMPAVLLECGFMDSKHDANLLLSYKYRAECAREIAQGICVYFDVPYIANDYRQEYQKYTELKRALVEIIQDHE